MSSYLHHKFIRRMRDYKIDTIIECGSRDCLDAIALYDHYHPSRIYAFECNPESIDVCKLNASYNPSIKIIEKAVFNVNGTADFYATDMEKSIDKNIGASSLLWHRDNKDEYFQKKIEVETIRLDTFMEKEQIKKIDLLCMDIQGAELHALDGMGERINDVLFIITEVSFESYYDGDYSFGEIRDYLDIKGFKFLVGSGLVKYRRGGFTNCLFQNKNIS